MSSTSFGLAQPTQCKCKLHLFPPHVGPLAHTGGSPPVLLCTAALFLSHLTHAPQSSRQIPSMSCNFLGQNCPFSSKECPSLSLKEMQWVLTIFCPFGALLSVCLLQQVSTKCLPVPARLCFQLTFSIPSSLPHSSSQVWSLLTLSRLPPPKHHPCFFLFGYFSQPCRYLLSSGVIG